MPYLPDNSDPIDYDLGLCVAYTRLRAEAHEHRLLADPYLAYMMEGILLTPNLEGENDDLEFEMVE